LSNKRIVRRERVAVPPELTESGIPPLLARIYAARHIESSSELNYGLDQLLPVDELKGLDAALTLLLDALQQQWSILIVGDFDADGATSTAVAVRALRLMGAAQVDFLVPNRFEYGYGLTPEIVAVAAAMKPDLIVTVDNGISSLQGVAAAKERGIRVLVTDHHLPGSELPQADAIINPNQPGDSFPSKNLAGVGVIFYLMLALRKRLRETGWFENQGIREPNLATLLDLVALGTVADVVPLDRNNRILVAQGLARIRAGKGCSAIQALIEVGKRQPSRLVAGDLGFAIGPRLNAAGRMDDMSLGIKALLSDDPTEARSIAAELDQLNQERRSTEEAMRDEAMADLDRMELDDEAEMPFGLCLYNGDWHQGVIGILASRIKDRVHRPVVVFTNDGEEGIKGSARSIPGLHIRDAFDAVAAHHPGLLTKFGGHAMAAGLSLKRDDFKTFSEAFDREVRAQLSSEDLESIVHSDGELVESEAVLELAEQLRFQTPWGQSFPEPIFDGEFEVAQQRIVGERHLKLVLRWPGSRQTVDAIAFNVEPHWLDSRLDRLHIAYRIDVNEWRGVRSLQLMVEHME